MQRQRLQIAGGILCLLFGSGFGFGVALAQVDKQELPFSAARPAGQTIYLSGEIPMKADGTVERGDTAAQTRQAMDNLAQTLKANGCTFANVVKVTVYLRSMDDYQAMNAVYRTYFQGAFPARECVGGLEIAFDSALEISAVAYKPN